MVNNNNVYSVFIMFNNCKNVSHTTCSSQQNQSMDSILSNLCYHNKQKVLQKIMFHFCSAYHGHVMSCIDISPYKLKVQTDGVHTCPSNVYVVSRSSPLLRPLDIQTCPLCRPQFWLHLICLYLTFELRPTCYRDHIFAFQKFSFHRI